MNISELFLLAKEKGASDLHFTVGVSPILRINGELERTDYPELSKELTHEILYSIMSDEQKSQYEKKHEIDFSLQFSDEIRFRVNVYKQRKGDSAAFRLIPSEIKTIEELGLPGQVEKLAGLKKGLILITGPTGSGKTTTLAAIVNQINKTCKDHIITIEEPIEFIHENKNSIITQREIGPHSESFATALRNTLREDPDVILVGEMRDLETISMAITAAETGHLVLATLHTNSCASTVDRIIDVFPSHQQQQIRVQLAASLKAVLAQTLVPKLDGSGLCCAMEIMLATTAVSSLIREGKSHQLYSTIQTSSKENMQTMDYSLKKLLGENVISKQEALIRALNKEEFEGIG